MAFETVKFEDITTSHLQQLVENSVPESRTLEYKTANYGHNDESRKEALKDITAFANSDGGHLIIGISEKSGTLAFAEGIDAASADKEIQRLGSMLRDNVEPSLIGHQIKSVPIPSNRHAIIVHVPRSWTKPHRTNFKNSKRFYVRNSNGVHEVSVDELRTLFLSSQSEMDRIRSFIENRLGALATGNGIMPLSATNLVALHIVPMLSFLGNDRIDIAQIFNKALSFFPMGTRGCNTGPNLDGLCNYSGDNGKYNTYTQIFRNWSVEAVMAGIERDHKEHKRLIPPWVAEEVVKSITRYEKALADNGVLYPLAVFVSFIGVKGAELTLRRISEHFYTRSPHPIDRDTLTLPETILDQPPESGERAAFRLKGTLDALWNAAGEIGCHWFDDNGAWRPPGN